MMELKQKESINLNDFQRYESVFREQNAHMQNGRIPISHKRWQVLNNINNIISIDNNTIATTNTISYEARFWNIQTKSLVYVLIQNHGWVRKISYSKKTSRLFLLLSPNVLLVFKKKKSQSKMEFTLEQQINLNSRSEIIYSNHKIYYAGENSDIGVINLYTQKIISHQILHKPALSLLNWNKSMIIGTDADIIFCNKINLIPQKIIANAHRGQIHILRMLKQTQYNQDILFTGSFDKKCKLWNPNNLELIKILDFSADDIQMIDQSSLLVNPFQYDKTSHCILLFNVNHSNLNFSHDDNVNNNHVKNFNSKDTDHVLPFSSVRRITSFHFIPHCKMFILGFQQNSFEVYQAFNRKQYNKKRISKILSKEINHK